MSSRTDKHEPPRPKPGAVGRFDKAFPVFLEGDRGVASGIGRNITDTGMFVETREPFPLGTRVKVTFAAQHGGSEMTLEAEVRYQCFINFARPDSTRGGMRGIGLKFVAPQQQPRGRGTVH
ncbi:MAG: PilZ domain-containing protein [Deltaproteobacteria bacterium]|nr:MAG: PilZ domain-containing protein [Deltaproteobacteria bacterium]